ncbi:MAG: hypothetical protein J6X95_09645 [Treponema sp.]|nr:hypothetical protein [Treponema sp.]
MKKSIRSKGLNAAVIKTAAAPSVSKCKAGNLKNDGSMVLKNEEICFMVTFILNI